jgi:hypothetical protein
VVRTALNAGLTSSDVAREMPRTKQAVLLHTEELTAAFCQLSVLRWSAGTCLGAGPTAEQRSRDQRSRHYAMQS